MSHWTTPRTRRGHQNAEAAQYNAEVAERTRLRAENEALRKEVEMLRWLCRNRPIMPIEGKSAWDSWLEQIDAAGREEE
jgi:hypothetical protein